MPTSSSTAANPGLIFDTNGGTQVTSNRVDAFNSVESAGKNVLLSFGGEGVTSAEYATFAASPAATQTLANILSAYVTNAPSYVNAVTGQTVTITTAQRGTTTGTFKGFSGIDLDFEDSNAFTNANFYGTRINGATFVSQLTLDLRAQLGNNYLITQAPQLPYLDSNFTKNGGSYSSTGGYQAILASGAGNATNWLNVQIYNQSTPTNPGDDGNNTVAGVVAAFEKLVTDNPGISARKFVLTLPIHAGDANDNVFTSAQLTMIVSQINSYLQSHGDGSLAGLAGFQLYEGSAGTTDADNLAFANAFLAGVPEPSTWALVACGLGVVGWTVRRRYTVRG